jgi:hypothetical protein
MNAKCTTVPDRPATIGFQIQTLMVIRAAQLNNQPASVAFAE